MYLLGHFNIDLSIGLRENSLFRTFILMTSKYRLKICELMSFKNLKQKLTGPVKLSQRFMQLSLHCKDRRKVYFFPVLNQISMEFFKTEDHLLPYDRDSLQIFFLQILNSLVKPTNYGVVESFAIKFCKNQNNGKNHIEPMKPQVTNM